MSLDRYRWARDARDTLRRIAVARFRKLPPKVRSRLVRAGTPNYTLGAVVLLRDHDDRLLLVRQLSHVDWSLPGGLMQRLESPRQAAAREVHEEIGVWLDPDQLVEATPNAQVNHRVQQVDMVFTSIVDAAAVTVTVDQVEIGAARWFALDALPSLTPTTRRLLGRYGLGPGTTTT